MVFVGHGVGLAKMQALTLSSFRVFHRARGRHLAAARVGLREQEKQAKPRRAGGFAADVDKRAEAVPSTGRGVG